MSIIRILQIFAGSILSIIGFVLFISPLPVGIFILPMGLYLVSPKRGEEMTKKIQNFFQKKK